MQAGQILEHTGHADVPRPDDADLPGQVRNDSAGAELFAQHMHGNRERAARTMLIRVAYQFNKDERQKQRGQEIKGAVLIARNAEVGAGFLARQLQIDLVVAGDFADLPVLKHLQTGAKSDDDAAAHILAGLLEDAVGRFRRMVHAQLVKDGVQLCFGVRGQQLIDLPNVLSVLRVVPLHIQHEGFQQIHLCAVPKVVAPLAARVFDDDIAKELRHQFLAVDFCEAVP